MKIRLAALNLGVGKVLVFHCGTFLNIRENLLKERFLEVTKVTKLSEEKAVTQASEIISEVKLF